MDSPRGKGVPSALDEQGILKTTSIVWNGVLTICLRSLAVYHLACVVAGPICTPRFCLPVGKR
ncbi:MAG: hypothetical protein CSA75_03385 [Sorangium cellulosum]|nr:MAG: hypothetical protein CSA75_03385 [Sorangium cellulosum]